MKKKNISKKINIPNMLTVGRIWVIPAIVLCLYFKDSFWASWGAVGLFILAGVTDYFDGYLARHLNQLSSFGRVLDPIADKLLVGAIIIMLAYSGRLVDYYCVIPAVIILCREILVSGLREFLAEIKVGLPVTKLAKWKTTFQMVALPVLMVAKPKYSPDCFHLLEIGAFALWFAAAMTVITGYDYWRSGSKYLRK